MIQKWLKAFVEEIASVLRGTFYKTAYKRVGGCHQCGKCCRHVYLRQGDDWIAEFDQYLQLIQDDPAMKRFRPKGRDDQGNLFFTCDFISRENKCLDYENRPEICRDYPSLSMLRYGAVPKETCGYSFVNRVTGKKIS